MGRNFFIEAFKYGIVGILNTLITIFFIWLIMTLLRFSYAQEETVPTLVISISNVMGYIAGFINSFIWNRKWTFKSKASRKQDFMRFIIAFLICYIPQLLLVIVLNKYVDIPSIELAFWDYSFSIKSAGLCQLTGIVFYTTMNFLFNKFYTFKK